MNKLTIILSLFDKEGLISSSSYLISGLATEFLYRKVFTRQFQNTVLFFENRKTDYYHTWFVLTIFLTIVSYNFPIFGLLLVLLQLPTLVVNIKIFD